MAIRTPHVAFTNLSKQFIALASSPQKRDSFEFLYSISVIEFEDERIVLTTIDAGMRSQILVDLPTDISPA